MNQAFVMLAASSIPRYRAGFCNWRETASVLEVAIRFPVSLGIPRYRAGSGSGLPHFEAPGPRTATPGRALVMLPAAKTVSPFTIT